VVKLSLIYLEGVAMKWQILYLIVVLGMVQEIPEIGLHFYFAQKTPVFENKCLANKFAATFTKPAFAG
jgi:hypothetical protein